MASVATCVRLDKALAESADSQFKGVKIWEKPLALLYRLKYWYHGGPTDVDDWVSGESSVFTVFLTAASNTMGECDDEILSLQNRYLDGSRPVDNYDSTGYTALHQAIILQKTAFVRALLDGGADRSLEVRSGSKHVSGLNAVELALWFDDQEFSPPSAEGIAEMLIDRN